MEIDFDAALDVEYSVVKNAPACRVYPIDILSAKLRGTDILHLLHIGHVMTLQRRVYNRLIDSGDIKVPVNIYGLEEV